MGAEIETIPNPKAPWPPSADNDPQFRFPKPYPLKKRDKPENFKTIAKDHALDAKDLVRYNFLTNDPKTVNWYLSHYVGCTTTSDGGGSYSFAGVVHDEKANRGVIFIPRFGDTAQDYANRIGQRVVDNYNQSNNKEPQGLCHRACYARVEEASRQGGGPVLPKVKWDDPKSLKDPFVILWSSYLGSGDEWFKLPEKYRGKGAAGAMAYKGWGTLVEDADFWAGKLKPGAVIQAWINKSDYERVRDGKKPKDYGHSFIFLNYVRKGGSITGMMIADQGFQSGKPLDKSHYGYWVGANIIVPPKKP